MKTATKNSGKSIQIALSKTALQQGHVFLFRGPEQSYIDAPLRVYLKSSVYEGNRLLDIYEQPQGNDMSCSGQKF